MNLQVTSVKSAFWDILKLTAFVRWPNDTLFCVPVWCMPTDKLLLHCAVEVVTTNPSCIRGRKEGGLSAVTLGAELFRSGLLCCREHTEQLNKAFLGCYSSDWRRWIGFLFSISPSSPGARSKSCVATSFFIVCWSNYTPLVITGSR